jgi:endonuclease/exonuclease/phosphatase family metal-dependent hydrolase
MKCVTYNIQYGIGLDDRYDIARIADSVRGADVIALQEVTRNNPKNGGHDMVAELRTELPDYFAVYGPNFEADLGGRVRNGRAEEIFFQFGNMVLSKTPIRASRNFLLPRSRSYDRLNLQRGALEALIETPLGFVRFYSTHLDHRSPDERVTQLRFLKERIFNYPLEGGALTGTIEMGFPEPPHTDAFVLMGDFNMLPGSPEYAGVVGHPDHEFGTPLTATLAVDAMARLAGPDIERGEYTTWLDPKRPADTSRHKRIDYVFTSASLAPKLRRAWIDRQAVGFDHLPVWVELE